MLEPLQHKIAMTKHRTNKKKNEKEPAAPIMTRPSKKTKTNLNGVAAQAGVLIQRIAHPKTVARASTSTGSTKSMTKTTSTAVPTAKTNATPMKFETNSDAKKIISDVSDYYSEDDDDSDSDFGIEIYYDSSDESVGFVNAHNSNGYSDSDSDDSSDTDDTSDTDDDGFYNLTIPATRIFTIVEHYSGYYRRFEEYISNFQQTATPIVKRRIQDFLRSNSTLFFFARCNHIVEFRAELEQLTGRTLHDYPVFTQPSIATGGLSPADISKLPRHIYRGQTQQEKRAKDPMHKCCICIAELGIGEELILLEKCSHRFHSECLGVWLKKSNQCPICRSIVN